MSTLTARDTKHVFEALRKGLVPERGIDNFAADDDLFKKQRGELHRQMELATSGEGTIKFLRGGYGCGKTFMARLALLDAQEKNFATSFVVVSDNDLRFHRFDDVYRKVMTELGTAACPRGALGDILDRWIGAIEDRLIDGGEDEEAPDFDEKVRQELQKELASKTSGEAPEDFVRVIQTIFDLKQQGEVGDAGSLISWLCGSGNVAASAKKKAGIKGEITSRDAMDYLRGVLEIVKAAGYKGMLIVIDEAETILRMRKDSRGKSLNGIRQIADAAGGYPGLLWLFTGTPDFFDTNQGVKGLTPLHDRIEFIRQGKYASVRQAQLELKPFNEERLRNVARRLRSIYPTQDAGRLNDLINDEFIDRLVKEVTTGFKGDVGVVPRQFLRQFVTHLDLVEDEPDYVPMESCGFQPQDLSDEEKLKLSGDQPAPPEDDDLVPVEDAW